MSKKLFETFRENIRVGNADAISTSYSSITTRLNKDFWKTDAGDLHRLRIGSYGRGTAIHNISDLDMVFELPDSVHKQYAAHSNNGPSQLLQAVRNSLKERYPDSEIKGDGQVVQVLFTAYTVEVLPGFLQADGSYVHPNSNNGGTWEVTNPRPEINAMHEANARTNGNLKHVCKMLRAWKNTHGTDIKGYLIDTLVYNFFAQTNVYDTCSYENYDVLMRDLFSFLGTLPHQDAWVAPGSGSKVTSGKFQARAKKAAKRCQEALSESSERAKATVWRKVFGRDFPMSEVVAKSALAADAVSTTEEFIEDQYPVDVRHAVEIDCEISAAGQVSTMLRRLLERIDITVPVDRDLRFYVKTCDVPKPYVVKWKVRNRGAFAERKGIRGQLLDDDGSLERKEKTSFSGNHYVECYVISRGVVVARDRIDVPI